MAKSLGLGAPLPSDDTAGSLPKKTNTSLDTLRQQLLGKKRAAEIQKAKASSTMSSQPTTRLGPPGSVLKDPRTAQGDLSSDDGDEGRAAAFDRRGTVFTGNRAKKRKRNDALVLGEDAAPGESITRENDVAADDQRLDVVEDNNPISSTPASVTAKKKARPKSLLDEILADKAGKRKKNKKG